MSPSLPRLDRLRRARRWLLPAALAALAPKCLLCLAAYAGLGAALGLPFARPELCGEPAGFAAWPFALGGSLGIGWWWSHRKSAPTAPRDPGRPQ